MNKVKLKVIGMTCVRCSASVERALNDIGATAHVNLSSGICYIKCDANIELKALKTAIINAGYQVEAINHQTRFNRLFIELIVGLILAFPLLYAHLHHFGLHILVPHLFMNKYFQFVLATLLQFGIGWRFYKRAFYNLKKKMLGMDVLVVIATSAAYILSVYGMIYNHDIYFECAAVVIAIINLGHYIERSLKKNTSKSLEKLMHLQAKEAYLIKDSVRILTKVEELKIGDTIEVLSKDIVPIDGILLDETATIDESLLSGEANPVTHKRNDVIAAGTLNKGALIRLQVAKSLEDSTLGKIIEAVEEATSAKPPLQKTADKISSFFVPVVIFISLFTFVLHYFILNATSDVALINAVSVLVVSCPCALGLAVPMSVMVGYYRSAKEGIIFKSGEVFEHLKSIDAVFFDKTGTLTHGVFEVNDIIGDKSYLPLLVALEKDSPHPIAISICEYFKQVDDGIKLNVTIIPGIGNKTKYNGHEYLVGSISQDAKIISEYQAFIERSLNQLHTVVALYEDGNIVLLLSLGDTIKPTSRMGIDALHRLGLKTYLLTGDNKNIAYKVAELVNIAKDDVYAEVKPIEKAKIIKNAQDKDLKVAFIGDGINDAVALETADLGIAMAHGSDIAILSADVTLLNKDMRAIAKTVKISKHIYQNIKQNFMWALLYNLVMVPLALMGYLSPVISAVAMVVSNIIVVLNSLRLRRKEK